MARARQATYGCQMQHALPDCRLPGLLPATPPAIWPAGRAARPEPAVCLPPLL